MRPGPSPSPKPRRVRVNNLVSSSQQNRRYRTSIDPSFSQAVPRFARVLESLLTPVARDDGDALGRGPGNGDEETADDEA